MTLRSSVNRYISEDVFFKAVLTLIIGMPVTELITEVLFRINGSFIPSSMEPVLFSMFGFLGTALTAVYMSLSVPQKRRIRVADIFYLTLVLFMVISAVFSRSPGVYSGGDANRCENPLHFLAYYWLFFAGSLIDDHKRRKNILFAFIAVAVLEGVFAFLQTFNIELSYSYLYRADRSAYGLTQNSNYYGALSVLFIACISGVYIFSGHLVTSKVFKCAMPVIAAFLFYTMLGSRARLAWVGFLALVVFYVISLAVMYRRDKEATAPAIRRALILAGAYTAVFLTAYFFTDYIREAAVRSYWEVAKGDTDMMGTRRLYLWKWGLKTVPDNWLTGVGLDNYGYVFESSPDFHEGMYMKDKAHCEYIHTLVTQGIPALINYLALLIYTGTGAVRNILKESSREKRAVTWVLLGMFITYLAQALFNNSITYVAMHLWLIVGLLIPRGRT